MVLLTIVFSSDERNITNSPDLPIKVNKVKSTILLGGSFITIRTIMRHHPNGGQDKPRPRQSICKFDGWASSIFWITYNLGKCVREIVTICTINL